MGDGYTSNLPSGKPMPTLEETLRLLNTERQIGTLHGFPVYIDPTVEPGMVEIRGGSNGTVRFSVDHPYVQGTSIAEAARKALGK
jgi:hypothetical protein